MKKFIYKLFL